MTTAIERPTIPRTKPSFLVRLVGAETRLQARRALNGYLFLSPWLIGLTVFTIGPILASAYFSVTQYDVLSPPRWVGGANYMRAFTQDNLFWSSLGRTLRYAVAVVPLGILGSLLLALLLNQGIKGTTFFRTVFFIPSLTPAVALALLWTWLLHPNFGPVNFLLESVGIPGPGWLTSKEWALWAIVLISLWSGWGGNRMLIFLAGLQGVPQSLYEAAEIDGANTWRKFWSVTLPMITPTLFFNLVLGVIGSLQVFTLAFVATLGGPSYATWFYALHIYRQAFEYFRMGYGSALAWIFVVVLLIFTYLQINLSRRWVYYAGESES